MENINKLICYLLAIADFSKDIHYNCKGDAFYGKHLFADRINENLYDYVDKLKEVCILGSGLQPLSSKEYRQIELEFLPEINVDDKINFDSLALLIKNTLNHINSLSKLDVADANLIGNIAEDLKNNLGLLNLQLE